MFTIIKKMIFFHHIKGERLFLKGGPLLMKKADLKKKNKIIHQKQIAVILLGISTILSGCSMRKTETNEIEDLTDNGSINYETATDGINSTSRDFEEQLVSGTYYVVHGDMYYPLYAYEDNYSGKEPKKTVDPERQIYYTTENEINIPTLFAEDKLIYYSTDTLLDYMTWERYYDLGYTIGVHNIQEMLNGRMYLDLDEDEDCIIQDSELYDIYNLGVKQVLLDKIGNVQITSDLITDNLINSVQKSKIYDLEVYTGTKFKHYQTSANIHAFKAYELFASTEYTTLQDEFYEITIPDYFVTGYYYLDNLGLVRIVRGNEYSKETNFNEQLLYPEPDEDDPEKYVAPRLYSTNINLNDFDTTVEGTLGYVSEDEVVEEEKEQENKDLEIKLKEASIKTVDLFFPENRDCKITIKSDESTGEMYLVMDGETGRRLLEYNRLDKCYELDVIGKNEKGTLTISGLYNDYDVELINCEQYTNQIEKLQAETESTENTTEEATEAETKTDSE